MSSTFSIYWGKKKCNFEFLLPFKNALFLSLLKDNGIQEKINLEIRIREGIWKLLSLSTQKDQVLHAVKNLMVCNARIMAYTLELQKIEEQTADQTRRWLVA